jgi:DNA-binding transcriptional regulator YhcF (GntR family)
VVARLAINPNTVLKVYRELEYEGLVAARPGHGQPEGRRGDQVGQQTQQGVPPRQV